MLAISTGRSAAALAGLRDVLAWPIAAAWPEDRPLADWQRAGGVAYRAPPLRTAYGALLNHRAALAALGDAVHAAPYKAPPQAPVLYIKPRNCFAGHGDTVVVPADAEALEVGATLGIVIGREAFRVGEAEALAWITTRPDVTEAELAAAHPAVTALSLLQRLTAAGVLAGP